MEIINMIKCEYCGKEIGLLAVRYTWLDKENKRAMHDKCYEKYKKEKIEQTDEEKQVQKEETKPLEKMVKSKIIGIVLLIFTSFFIISFFYSRFTTGTGTSIFNAFFYGFSLLIGIELVDIKKEGIYNKLLLICGIILIVIYVIWLITIAFAISLW